MGNLEDYAERELRAAGYYDKDSIYGGMLAEAVMRLVRTFAAEVHSGASGSACLAIFDRVARFEPLTPLTGEDDEWNQVEDDAMRPRHWQNKRCSRVFKKASGEAYDIRGKVFRLPNGITYTSNNSTVPVTFPYTPTTVIVDSDGKDMND